MHYLYIIESINHGKWYTGITDNLNRRLSEHNRGKTTSTKPYIPYKLIYCEEYETKTEARKREIQIKKSGIIRKQLKHKLNAVNTAIRGPIV